MGRTLPVPFSFAYVPELLLLGTPLEVAHATGAYLLGNLALAMGLQGAEFLRGPIAPWRRGLFFLAAGCLMFPASWLIDLLGLGLMAAAWCGSFLPQAMSRRA